MDGTNKLIPTTIFLAISTIATTILYATATQARNQDESVDDENVQQDKVQSGDVEHDDDPSKDDPMTKSLGDSVATSKDVAPFPWEIATSKDDSVKKSEKKESKHESIKNRHHVTSNQSQLDFLASMTFANGGLRSPSCPCCI